MNATCVVGHIRIKDPQAWDAYRSQVPATLAPWGAELLLRGRQQRVLAGAPVHTDIVVIRFPDQTAAEAWYASAAYQALVPLRERAADVDLVIHAT